MGTFELIIVLLIVLLDVVVIRQIIRKTTSGNARYIYIMLVLFFPIGGILLYYLIRYLVNLQKKE